MQKVPKLSIKLNSIFLSMYLYRLGMSELTRVCYNSVLFAQYEYCLHYAHSNVRVWEIERWGLIVPFTLKFSNSRWSARFARRFSYFLPLLRRRKRFSARVQCVWLHYAQTGTRNFRFALWAHNLYDRFHNMLVNQELRIRVVSGDAINSSCTLSRIRFL